MLLKERKFERLKSEYLENLFRYGVFSKFKKEDEIFDGKIIDVDDYGNLVLETSTKKEHLAQLGWTELLSLCKALYIIDLTNAPKKDLRDRINAKNGVVTRINIGTNDYDSKKIKEFITKLIEKIPELETQNRSILKSLCTEWWDGRYDKFNSLDKLQTIIGNRFKTLSSNSIYKIASIMFTNKWVPNNNSEIRNEYSGKRQTRNVNRNTTAGMINRRDSARESRGCDLF